MTTPASKFHAGNHGFWAELMTTAKYVMYVVLTVCLWVFYGARVRRAYKKATKEGRIYQVDRMPGGENGK